MADENLYQYFKIEAREIASDLSRDLLALEKGSEGVAPLARLLRKVHTLKGAARVARLPRIAAIAHAMEGELTSHRDAPEAITKQKVGHLLQQVDLISSEVRALDPPPLAAGRARASGFESFEQIRVDLAEMDALLSGVSETAVQLDGMRREIEGVKRVEEGLADLAEQMNAAGGTPPRLRDAVEEMRTALQHSRQSLATRVDNTDREITEVRGDIDRLRLLSASLLFPVLERAVRAAAEALGKKVGFETSGREQRLESHVLAALGEALSHLVRNAVAHGIESPQERLAQGKPERGEVRLKIERRADRIVFTCSDDGRGIDVEAVRGAAVSCGVLSAASAAELPAASALDLIFSPGVTTSAMVNEVAGRGIGLDVVREVANRIKGRVAVTTELGQGTSVAIEVPLSLSSVRAVLLGGRDLLMWVPLEAVNCALRLERDAIVSLAGRESLIFDGRAIPFIRLAEAMRRPLHPGGESVPRLAAVVRAGTELLAVGVDRAIRTNEVIVHPLPAAAGDVAILAGAVFDAQGNPQLVLNPKALLKTIHTGVGGRGLQARPVPRILVIDDSLTSRMQVQGVLEAEGYDIDLAVSGEDAMGKARSHRYNLLVCDVEMPGVSGFELVARTRENHYLLGIPSILIIAREGPDERGAAAGARAYIVKGQFSQDALIETVRTLVG